MFFSAVSCFILFLFLMYVMVQLGKALEKELPLKQENIFLSVAFFLLSVEAHRKTSTLRITGAQRDVCFAVGKGNFLKYCLQDKFPAIILYMASKLQVLSKPFLARL